MKIYKKNLFDSLLQFNIMHFLNLATVYEDFLLSCRPQSRLRRRRSPSRRPAHRPRRPLLLRPQHGRRPRPRQGGSRY